MQPPSVFYSTLLFTVGIASLLMSALVWQSRQSSPSAKPLVVLLFGLAIWDLTYAVFTAGVTVPNNFFWLDMTYFAVAIVPSSLLIFVLYFVQLDYWVKKPLLLAMTIEPVVTIIMLWTDPWHGLFYGGYRAPNQGMIFNGGPFFWVNLIYSYCCVFLSYVMVIRYFFRAKGLYRQQAASVFWGITIPWANSIVLLFGLIPGLRVDTTPIAFSLSTSIFAFALIRFHLLEIVPLAQGLLIENIADGILVLDNKQRVVDLNPAATNALNMSKQILIGKDAHEIFNGWKGVAQALAFEQDVQREITIGDPLRHLEVRFSPLFDSKQQPLGKLVHWRDITAVKNAQIELEKIATTDGLTGAFNRRHFLSLMEKEVQRAWRFSKPLALVLIDIDFFKNINDTYGHSAGDYVLKSFAEICQKHLRTIDIFARFGGEEFVILLPETDLEQAFVAAERLRQLINNTDFICQENHFLISISLGISALRSQKDSIEAVLHRADQALYTAKENGRNRSVSEQAFLLSPAT